MTVLGTDLGVCVIIYIINWVLVCRRPEMAWNSVPPRGTDV